MVVFIEVVFVHRHTTLYARAFISHTHVRIHIHAYAYTHVCIRIRIFNDK